MCRLHCCSIRIGCQTSLLIKYHWIWIIISWINPRTLFIFPHNKRKSNTSEPKDKPTHGFLFICYQVLKYLSTPCSAIQTLFQPFSRVKVFHWYISKGYLNEIFPRVIFWLPIFVGTIWWMSCSGLTIISSCLSPGANILRIFNIYLKYFWEFFLTG